MPASPSDVDRLLWAAADALRGSFNASQYKHIILSVVFLKSLSEAFTERRAAVAAELHTLGIEGEQFDEFLEDPDEYTSVGIAWLPPAARWSEITAGRTAAETGTRLNEALAAVAQAVPALADALPRPFPLGSAEQRALAEVVRLIGEARFNAPAASSPRDDYGIPEIYSNLLAGFAEAEGRRGGEFFTPRSVVQLLVELLEPVRGEVYDPACGAGGMLLQAASFARAHGADPADLTLFGQDVNETTALLARMNLAIHGFDGSSQRVPRGDSLTDDHHHDRQFDFVLSHPPFDIRHVQVHQDDPRWEFGVPPMSNANYAWLQDAVSKLSSRGTACVVLSNDSLTPTTDNERRIRQGLIEADLVAAIVALPAGLFTNTTAAACCWILAKDKSRIGGSRTDRRGQVLLIDAQDMGAQTSPAVGTLRSEEISRLYHSWRGTRSGPDPDGPYRDLPGRCVSVDTPTLRDRGYALTPAHYVFPGNHGARRHPPVPATRNLYGLFS